MPSREFSVFSKFTNTKSLRAVKLVFGFGTDVFALCIFKMLYKVP